MEDLRAKYILNDGEIRSLQVGLEYASAGNSALRQATVTLLVRKRSESKKLEYCLLHIQLMGVRQISLNEDFGSCYYSDIVFKKTEEGLWYISLDPYGNSGEPHEEDNWVIVAESVSVVEGIIPDGFQESKP